MKNKLILFFLLIGFQNVYSQLPGVNSLDPGKLLKNKQAYLKKESAVVEPVNQLIKVADSYLRDTAVAVTDKDFTPPSGSKHDYMSMGPYWWPDSSKADGLPYIRKDGLRNPEIRKITDRSNLGQLEMKCKTLALAYFFTGKKEYAEKAVAFLQVWFLNPNTKMNPNLDYAQAIPGLNDGRGIGIIESRLLADLADWIALLRDSPSLSSQDLNQLKDWYKDFLHWMLNSKNGKEEQLAQNNHGTYYDYQVAAFALFIGDKEQAKSILTATKKRILVQVKENGEQPLELARTNAYGYSTMNLDGWFKIAMLGDKVGLDFWNYAVGGKSLKKALNYIIPYALGEKAFTYSQISNYNKNDSYPLLLIAADKFNDKSYLEKAKLASAGGYNFLNDLLYK